MRIRILPESPLGRWSVGLAVAFILLFALFQVWVAFGQRGPGLTPGPVLPPKWYAFINWNLAMYGAGISGIAALVTGVISMIKSK